MNKREKNKISKLILSSIIISLIIELILSDGIKNFSVIRLITICATVTFVLSHFILGFKKVWDFIVDNRYKLSFFMIIISTVIGFFQNSLGVKEWLFTTDVVLSLVWNIRFYVLMLVTYELFLILTNENRNLSIIGTIVVTFSGFVAWNFVYIDALILGELITVLINKILILKNRNQKIISAVATIALSIIYTFTFNEYAISFGYVFFALIIWILIKNRKLIVEENINKVLLLLNLVFSIIGIIIAKNIFNYNGMPYTININQDGFSGLFNYLCNTLLPFSKEENIKSLGSFISIFPIPMLFSLYYLYKEEKHTEFLLPITIVAVVETIYCISGFPKFIGDITFLGKVNNIMCMPAVNYANLLIMFYVLENVTEKIFKFNITIRITIISACLLVFVKRPAMYTNLNYLYLYVSEMCLLAFLFLNIDDKRYKKTFLFFLVLITLIGGVTVNPIIKDNKAPVEHKLEEKLVL